MPNETEETKAKRERKPRTEADSNLMEAVHAFRKLPSRENWTALKTMASRFKADVLGGEAVVLE